MSRKRDVAWDRVTALAAVAIAVLAVAVSVWQGLETRKNYRLSVRPKLELVHIESTQPTDSARSPGLYVRNVGVGPAIIRNMSATVDGEPVAVDDKRRLPGSVRDRLSLPETMAISMRELGVIQAGAEVPFMTIALPYSKADSEVLTRELDRVGLVIQYDSLYDEHFGGYAK